MVQINLAEVEENDTERVTKWVNKTRQAAAVMYNPNIHPQYKYTRQRRQQKSRASNCRLMHPDVKFKRLPFFDVVSDLVKPSSLLSHRYQRHQEATFGFELTLQQAVDIASTRDISPGARCPYMVEVQMRFCLLKTSCEQEDCFPAIIVVKVNGELCPLPIKLGVYPKRPPGPVHITPMVKLSPTVTNTIHVSWAAKYRQEYVISITMVRRTTSTDLLHRLKSRGINYSDHTRRLIMDKLNEVVDGEISTTLLRVSLLCPLGKMRMTTPCRAIACTHLQCFDALLFLQMNEKKPTWICPVCDKPALYDNLVIDGYFQEVLSSSESLSEIIEIQLLNDGMRNGTKLANQVEELPEVSLDLTDDLNIITAGAASLTQVESWSCEKPKVSPESQEIVDLTALDSDDDVPM